MFDADQPGFANPNEEGGAGVSTLERTETVTQEDTQLNDNSDNDRYAHDG